MRKTDGRARLVGFDTPFYEAVWIAKEIARMTAERICWKPAKTF